METCRLMNDAEWDLFWRRQDALRAQTADSDSVSPDRPDRKRIRLVNAHKPAFSDEGDAEDIASYAPHKEETGPSYELLLAAARSFSRKPAAGLVKPKAAPAYLPANAAKPKASSIMRRCGTCPACRAPDCGVCKECRDKPKFGGAGIRKKPCIGRICQQTSARREQLAPPAFAGAYAMKQTSSPLVAMPAAAYAMQQTSSPSPALAPLMSPRRSSPLVPQYMPPAQPLVAYPVAPEPPAAP